MSFSRHDGLQVRFASRGARFPRDERKGSVMQQRIKPNLWFDTEAEEAAG
jgi:hypothetical protein